MSRFPLLLALAGVAGSTIAAPAAEAPADSTRELVGLWEGLLRFGPDERGTLTLRESGGAWTAGIAGRAANATHTAGHVEFSLADDRGAFRGDVDGDTLRGFWIQPPTIQGGGQRFATPVVLRRTAPGLWRGTVAPLDDRLTMYLKVSPGAEGTTSAFLVNPERNLGRFLDVTRLARNGDDDVDLIGKPFGAKAERVISTGSFDAPDQRLRIFIPWHGDYYDLTRADKVATTGYYPRGNPPAKYRYASPPALDDGWPVADLADVGMSQAEMEKFVQWLIDMPIESVHSSQVHAVLVARHGKLVLEEYFHGFHRDLPHDTRSAAKSLTSMLVGAAIESGAKLSLDTPVHAAMNGGEFPPGVDAGRRAITVEHLLTMSAGLDCDDADDQSRGNEDTMQQQSEQPDWYRYTLDLAVEAKPGAKSVYCSAYPNLLGGVLQRTTGERLPELLDRLIARPLGISRYHMNLTPTGDAYMGGGNHFLPRDFMKLGQVMLDGGTWGGHRVLAADFVKRSARGWYESRGIRYGYLWWVMDYPYGDRTVQAFFAGGNGGQTVICIPELDLLVAFFGGNYSDAATLKPQREFVPQHILPAIRDDAAGAISR